MTSYTDSDWLQGTCLGLLSKLQLLRLYLQAAHAIFLCLLLRQVDDTRGHLIDRFP
jgi:hypothetical protein